MDYISTKEAAKKWGVTLRYVQKLIADGRVPGAKKYGVSWMIPSDCEKPGDPRKAVARTPEPPLSFFPMLYIRGGDADAAVCRCHSELERALLAAQRAIFGYEAQIAMDIAVPLFQNASDSSIRLGAGVVIALAAMSCGDVQMWQKTLADIGDIPFPENRQFERALAVAMLDTGMHGKNTCPEWLKKGDFSELPPEYFPIARYLYVKNTYIYWKEIELIAVAEPLISECRREKSDLAEIYMRVIAAVAYHDLGKNAEACAHIMAAAAIAEPTAIYSPFVEYFGTLGYFLDDCLKDAYPTLYAQLQKWAKVVWNHWLDIYNDLRSQPHATGLTPRELEACRLTSRGMTTREVAKRMGISQSSVKKYLNVAYSKMNVDKKEELRRLIHP